ncbi:MAG: glycosyltransferase family 39 protein [Candidatus ainarchaeum sp.]|nr:glycosyltransferase family 39 protein [Candidatus ainarchaeum sp.]
MDSREALGIAFIALVFASSHLLLFDSRPLFKDEALYAQTISELLQQPEILPAFNGETFTWKPMLFFYYCSPVVLAARDVLPVGIENQYRAAPAIAGFAATLALFFLLKRLTGNADLSILAAAAYAASNVTALADTALLTDSTLMLLTLSGLYFYVRAGEAHSSRDSGRMRLFLAAASAASFLAFLTKTYAALLLPALAVAHFFFSDRKFLARPAFIATFAAPALAAALHAALFASQGLLAPLLVEYFFNAQRAQPFTYKLGGDILVSLVLLAFYAFPWFVFAGKGIMGARPLKGPDVLMAFWLLFALPGLVGTTMYWYFLPLIPPTAYFAAKGILEGGKLDKLTAAFFVLLLAFSIILGPYSRPFAETDARELGYMLSGKQDVLVIANWSPTILFYKAHDESPGERAATKWVFATDSAKLGEPDVRALMANSGAPANSTFTFSGGLNDLFTTRDFLIDGPDLEWRYVAIDSGLYRNYSRLFDAYGAPAFTKGLSYAVVEKR